MAIFIAAVFVLQKKKWPQPKFQIFRRPYYHTKFEDHDYMMLVTLLYKKVAQLQCW